MVTLNGNKVTGWAFDTNNVLSFEHQAGYSAWLQFTHLPGGPLFMGTVTPSCAEGYVSDVSFQVLPPSVHTADQNPHGSALECAHRGPGMPVKQRVNELHGCRRLMLQCNSSCRSTTRAK